MTVLKRLELWGKLLLATVGAALLWRPGRRAGAAARLASAKRVLLVRVDDRVGEALLTTPLITSLRRKGLEVAVLVHPRCHRVLRDHPDALEVLSLDRRMLWLGALAPGIRAVRARRYDVVVNCANWEVPSVTSALVSRLCAAGAVVVGPSMAPVRWLTDAPVAPRTDTASELAQRHHLLSPLGVDGPPAPLSFRSPRTRPPVQALVSAIGKGTHAVVNPGGRLGWRRLPAGAFAAAARALAAAGRTPIVTWGPGEEALAREVVAASPGAELAPQTDLDELAALMGAAGLTVCNNTGPMHLSVAVGAPTLAFFYKMPVERWGHAYLPHRMVDLTAAADVARAAGEEAAAFTDAQSGRASSTSIVGMPSLIS